MLAVESYEKVQEQIEDYVSRTYHLDKSGSRERTMITEAQDA